MADDAAHPVTPATDEPKTETTLTTRVRINIPGSRPIPPVVVRTPVDGASGGAGGAESAAEPTELPSSWTVGGDPSPAPGSLPGSVPGSFPGAPAAPARAAGPAPSPAPAPAAEAEKAPSDWFAPRKSAAPAPAPAPAPFPAPAETTQQIPAPAPPLSPFPQAPDATQPLSLGDIAAAGPVGPAAQPPQGRRPNIPYLNEGPAGPGSGPGPVQGPGPGPRPFPGTTGVPGGPGSTPFPSYQPPAGPTAGPVTGEMQVPPAAFPGDRLSGDTVVSGIPAVPPAGPPVTKPAQSGSDSYRFEADQDEPAPKGRSKVILAGVALLVVAGFAYGAGLLMDHADVPAGTTVLGIDIGGKSRSDAVTALDSVLGDRETAPLTVTVGKSEEKIKPSSAGLDVDIDATVSSVAHRDYNPVTVIGSLFGGTRQAEPTMVTDEEKLRARLNTLSDQLNSGSTATDGMVKFVNGKAVAVPGSAHQAVNVDSSLAKVTAAYRTRLETGSSTAVPLSVTTVQPKVTQAKLDAAVNGFGKTAMSGLVTFQNSSGVFLISFGPQKSLPKFVTMVAVNGELTPHIDLTVLKSLYGHAFDGILLQRGDGSKTAVTPQDVASAMLPALQTTDATKKIVTFSNEVQ
ncbi:MAG: hypothetical protein QOF84_4106 [Streptomyces sp.]|nr:hypothetical protein [Streptomyces sp.]